MFNSCSKTNWLMPLLVCLVFSQNLYAKEKPVDLSGPYAIVLASSVKNFTREDLANVHVVKSLRYYIVKSKTQDKIRYQLRLGFFKTKDQAKKSLSTHKLMYKNAYLVTTKQTERDLSIHSEIKPTSNVQLADYLILSTAYKAASTLAKIVTMKTSTETETVEKEETVYDSYLVINLNTTNSLDKFNEIIKHPKIANNAFYISQLKIDGATWYQYRLGFFVDLDKANEKLASLTADFPLARLIRVTREEKEDAIERVRSFFAAVPSNKSTKPLPKLAPVPKDQLKELIQKGTAAISAKNYASAINNLSLLLRYPENRYSKDAQEYLGFAYELNGDISSARTEYERYLSLYPGTNGSRRINQRLASLITAREDPQKKLRETKERLKNAKWEHFGSISEFYREDESRLNEEEVREDVALLSSSINVNSRYRGADYIMNSRFTGSNTQDFIDGHEKSINSISSLYFDVTDVNSGLHGAFGRLSIGGDGVLGLFDGVNLSYQLNDYIKLKSVAGYIVDDRSESANTDKFFSGISTDLGTFLNSWDINVFYIKQQDGQLTAREAVGSVVRYFDTVRRLHVLVDYDIYFDDLNTILAIGSWTFQNRVQVNATIDIRKSPILTTRQALSDLDPLVFGTPLPTTVDELLLTGMTEEEIRQRVLDLTPTNKSFMLGVSGDFSKTIQFNGDVTGSRLSTSETGDFEYFYNMNVVQSSLFMENDAVIYGLRHSDTDRSSINSFSLNLRFPLTRNLRLNPRLRYDIRENSSTNSVTGFTTVSDQRVSFISLRTDYRVGRRLNFEFEFGKESSDTALDENTTVREASFMSLGLRYDF